MNLYFNDNNRINHKKNSKKFYKKKDVDKFRNRSSQRKKQRICELQEEEFDDDVRYLRENDYEDNFEEQEK